MVLILERGPLSVGEISSVLGLSQSNASHHLKQLTDAGIVHRRGERGWAFYSVHPAEPFVGELVRVLAARREALPFSAADMRRLAALYRERSNRSREFFAALGDRWNSVRESLPPPSLYLDTLARQLDGPDALLEVGVGAGHMIPFLAGLSRRVVGVDNSPEMLDSAGKTALEQGLSDRVEFRLGEAEHLPMGDASVDAVLMHFMLHHAASPRDALHEAARVLRSRGRLVVVEFTRQPSDSFRQRHGDLWPGFSPEELTEWCAEAGLAQKDEVFPDGQSIEIILFMKGDRDAR